MGIPARQSHADVADPSRWTDDCADSLYAFALARVRDPDRAEDLVQETFLAGLSAIATFRRESSVLTWLTGILRRKIADEVRTRQRRFVAESPEPDSRGGSTFFDEHGKWLRKTRAWRFDPQEIVQSREFWETFEACVEELPPTLSAAFCLKQVDGLKSPEVCSKLQISDANLAVRMHRARLSLRECLEHNWFE